MAERVATSFQVVGATIADIDPEIDVLTDGAIDTVEPALVDVTSNYISFQLDVKCQFDATTNLWHEFRMKVRDKVLAADAAGITAAQGRIKAAVGDFLTGVTNTVAETNYSTVLQVRGSGRLSFWYDNT